MNQRKTYTVRRISKGEGKLYQSIRLEALRESPEAFSASYEAALGRDMESWDNQADAAAEGGDRAIFVVQFDEPVGLAALYRDAENPSQGELVQMWIAPSERGSGIAEVLLNHLFEWAAGNSYETVRAEVTDGNQHALRFYLRYGFRMLESAGTEMSLVKSIKDIEIGLRPATAEDLEWRPSAHEAIAQVARNESALQ
jgi:GNAT superfamily N-acetyltransferase